MRARALLLIVSAWAVVSGCTFVGTRQYLAPTADGAKYSTVTVMGVASGRSNSLLLETKELCLGVHCMNEGATMLLLGPVVPVVPVFLLIPFFSALSEPMKLNPLLLALEVEPRAGVLEFTPGKVNVVDSSGRSLRIREIRRGPWDPSAEGRLYYEMTGDPAVLADWKTISSEESSRISSPAIFVFELEMTEEPEDRSFDVELDGLSRSGSSVVVPTIHLEPASGLVCMFGV